MELEGVGGFPKTGSQLWNPYNDSMPVFEG